jgi:ribosomal protein L7/L12
MKIESIRVANNGFILENHFGDVYIAKTLTEVAQLAGEFPVNPSSVVYANGCNADTLRDARSEAQRGNKINAIKILRDAFTNRLGLREAKEIVEVLIYNQ